MLKTAPRFCQSGKHVANRRPPPPLVVEMVALRPFRPRAAGGLPPTPIPARIRARRSTRRAASQRGEFHLIGASAAPLPLIDVRSKIRMVNGRKEVFTMSQNKPAHEIRIGAVKAAIWDNSTADSVRHNVTFSRIYRDGDEWKRTESFGRDDLLVLAKLADQAHTWICEQKAQSAPAPAQEPPRKAQGQLSPRQR